MKVLAQVDGLVVVDKPPDMLVIPGRDPDDHRNVRDGLTRQLGTKVWVCHRIDRDTSGVLLMATTAEAHRAASMAFENGEAKKQYLALVEGVVRDDLDVELPLIEGRKGKIRLAFPGEDAKNARTLVHPLKTFESSSFVRCEPLTGRQHQIRAHLKAKGHPLLFDHQYGRKQPLEVGQVTLTRTPLHAARLEILGHVFESPLAADLQAVLDALSLPKTEIGR